MRERYPDIIKQDKCLFCEDKLETFEHLIQCNSIRNTWYRICKCTLKAVEKRVKKEYNKEISTDYILRNFINNRSNEQECTNTLLAIIRGFISKSFMKLWKKKELTHNQHINIFKQITKTLQLLFFEHIWKSRCNRLALWQQHNKINF